MKKVIKYAFAFIGVIVGAGFASGQEILQYFTSFGLMGIVAAITSMLLFGYLGYVLLRLGSRMKAKSHRGVIDAISGRYLGRVIDWILVFALFGTGVVMIAGAGSNLNQQFGFPFAVGASLMAILIIVAGLAKLDRFISIIGSITPFLILTVVILAVYSIFTMDSSFASLHEIAIQAPSAVPNWFLAAVNYVTFNLAFGATMAILMGGNEEDERTAALGGLAGGLGVGILIIIAHLAIFSKVESIQGFELPLLAIADQISPILGFFMSIVLFGMIFNTGASMFFSFSTRFAEPGTKKFKLLLIVAVIVGYILSYVGFTDLVGTFYPFLGYISLILVGALIVASFRMKKFKPIDE